MKKCPVCSSELMPKVVQSEKQGPMEIDACLDCASLWFNQGEAEAILYSKLADLIGKPRPIPKGNTTYTCPTCDTLLKPLKSPNLPREINASVCPSCRGTLFSAQDLQKYKVAQRSKMAYFKNFHIPLPPSSLLLTGIIGFLFIGTITFGSAFKNRSANQVRAQRLINAPVVSTLAPNRVTLTFTTASPVKSKIQVSAPYIVEARLLPVSNNLTTFHQIMLKNLRSSTEYSYKIIVFDENNIKTTSEDFRFQTP